MLFGGGDALKAATVAGLIGAPGSAAPLDAVAAGLDAAAALLQERQEFARRRQAVIAANPELQERELVKLAGIAAALGAALRERGTGEPAASLAGARDRAAAR